MCDICDSNYVKNKTNAYIWKEMCPNSSNNAVVWNYS